VEKSLIINGLLRRFFIFKVSHESVAAFYTYFAYPVLSGVEDFHCGPLEFLAN
jgi:hypothetical protein